MRHLLSFLLSLVLAPLIYISAGFSAVKFGEASGLGQAAVLGLVAAFIAGGLYAVLVMSRLSPVGPVIAGLLYLGITLWALLDRASFVDVVPRVVFGQGDLLYVPVGFGTTLLAAPLLFTIFSPRRWRSGAQPAPATFDAAPTYAGTPTTASPSYADTDTTETAAPSYAAPAYTPPSYGATTYEPPVYTPPTSYSPPAQSPAPEPTGNDGERTGLM
jgi:hypothetical protein